MDNFENNEEEIYVNLDFESYELTKEEMLEIINDLLLKGYMKTMEDPETGETLYSLTKEGEKIHINNLLKIFGRNN